MVGVVVDTLKRRKTVWTFGCRIPSKNKKRFLVLLFFFFFGLHHLAFVYISPPPCLMLFTTISICILVMGLLFLFLLFFSRFFFKDPSEMKTSRHKRMSYDDCPPQKTLFLIDSPPFGYRLFVLSGVSPLLLFLSPFDSSTASNWGSRSTNGGHSTGVSVCLNAP